MALEALDILTGWADLETSRQDRALNFVVATLLFKLGETVIEVSQDDLLEVSQGYVLERSEVPDTHAIKYRLVKLNVEPEPELDLG